MGREHPSQRRNSNPATHRTSTSGLAPSDSGLEFLAPRNMYGEGAPVPPAEIDPFGLVLVKQKYAPELLSVLAEIRQPQTVRRLLLTIIPDT